MTNEEWMERRRREYATCKVRGHQPSGETLLSNPAYEVCKWCGTGYRYEQVLREVNAPVGEVTQKP